MRAIRKYGNKQAEIFYLIIKNTVEEKWYTNSHKSDRNYITINESGLEQVLKGENLEPVKQKSREIMFRF